MWEGKVPLRSGKPKAGGSTPGATILWVNALHLDFIVIVENLCGEW